MEVHLGSWSSVSPLHPVKEGALPLSPLDNFFIYAACPKKVLFFRNPEEDCDATTLLKESLAKTLDHFYPLAGRISFKTPEIQLQLHCSNSAGSGAAFVEAATTATLADVGDVILPSEFTDKLCQTKTTHEYPWNESHPLLSVQVTKFSCGGLSLGVTFSHQICDGVGFWYFMNSWAETARLGAPLVLPALAYQIQDCEFPEKMPPGVVPTLRRDVFQAIRDIGWKKSAIHSTMLVLSKAKLKTLKSWAPGCTTFDVTVAYMWQRVAATWDCDESGTATLMSLVNCRGRTSWIGDNYFGNAVLGASATVPTISQLRRKSLAVIAQLVHDGFAKSCTKESIESGIRAQHLYDENEELVPFLDMSSIGQMCIIVGSSRHRIYDIDFGWGKVCNSAFGTHDLCPNKIYLFPSAHEDGGIDVTIALTDRCMRLFVNQPDPIPLE